MNLLQFVRCECECEYGVRKVRTRTHNTNGWEHVRAIEVFNACSTRLFTVRHQDTGEVSLFWLRRAKKTRNKSKN